MFQVESGVTSVFLDLELLETAAGITLAEVNSEADPFSEDFQVGFNITSATDFTFSTDPFTPIDGTIEHDGTITLALGDASVMIGNFSIGFDSNRVSDTTSGFFVADTLPDIFGLEILFDLGAPEEINFVENDLDIGNADLLLSPEFATALTTFGADDFTGTDVGNARIDATAVATEDPMPMENSLFNVESGVTSIFLDFELLETAAGLTFVSADSEVQPFSEDFQVGFAINDQTDFSFTSDPFTAVDGRIEHDGSITVTAGGLPQTFSEFSIGFDSNRASDTASGFFIADNIDVPIFDIGIPEAVNVGNEDFSLTGADILLSPEFAAVLQIPDLAGADIGDTRIDATTEEIIPEDSFVRFRNEAVSGSYLYVSEAEAEGIRENFADDFTEEGSAFDVSSEQQNGLVQFNRFRNNSLSGSYIFANEEESQNIRDNFSDVFTDEGTSFFAYAAGSGIGENVVRFRNLNGSGYVFALGEEAQNIRDNFSDIFAEEGVAFETVVA